MSSQDQLNDSAASLAEQTATRFQRRGAALACLGYAILALALVPLAARPLPAMPHITGIYATAVLVADVCTYVLLTAQFRASGARWLLVLGAAYLYSAIMALLHVLTFPGALLPDAAPVLGSGPLVGWLYSFWSLGFVALLLYAVVLSAREIAASSTRRTPFTRVATTFVIVLGGTALLLVGAMVGIRLLPPPLLGDQFAVLNIWLNGASGLLAMGALAVLWRSRRRVTIIPLWLSLILVAAATAPLLTDLGGRRYTFGWYAGRASFAVASCVLLAVVLSEVAKLQGTLARMVTRLREQTRALSEEQALRRAYAEARKRQQEAESLATVARTINTLELDAALQNIAESACALLEADVATVYQLDARGDNLVLIARGGPRGALLDPHVSIARGGGLVWLAVERREAVASGDLLDDGRFSHAADMRERIQAARHRAALAVPLTVQGRISGALFVGALPGRVFSDDEVRLVSTFADQAAVAIANAQLYDDLRQSKQAAEEARDEQGRSVARLEAADRAKDEFLAMLSHELRNPLGAITVALGVLNVAGASAQNARRAHSVIERQVKHLSTLVDDLLDVSRVTTGKILLNRQALDLGSLVAGLVTTWRDAGRFHRHDVSCEPSPAWIDGDRTRIEQILDNLVSNALKYTPPGGRIGVRVGADGVDAILEVVDTGIGISPRLVDKVFDLFVQGDHGLDRADGGLGIGLTLVKTLAVLHGGSVTVESDGPGKGSTFVVRLPRTPERAT